MRALELMVIFASVVSLICFIASLWLNNESSTA